MEKIFNCNVTVKGTVTYTTEGITSFEPDKDIITIFPHGRQVRQRGVLLTDDKGTSLFTPYNTNLDVHRYNKVFSTLNGLVYTTQKRNIVLKLTIQSGISQQEMARIIREETSQMITFIKSTEGKEALK